MIFPIIVGTNGPYLQFRHKRIPEELKPIEVRYRRFDERTGVESTIKYYFEVRRDVTKTVMVGGKTYYIHSFITEYGNQLVDYEKFDR